jgi:hypothetical protein
MGAYKSIITDIQCALEDGNLEAALDTLSAVNAEREDKAQLLLTALELALGRYGDE